MTPEILIDKIYELYEESLRSIRDLMSGIEEIELPYEDSTTVIISTDGYLSTCETIVRKVKNDKGHLYILTEEYPNRWIPCSNSDILICSYPYLYEALYLIINK